ncbi:MAG TPA: peptidoglycan-associated lipoprotein Pal [Burkholderiales bacterium]|nr:peptidoglycan-associated lipoprotein Pal [Burkholderiales bacterium]
MNWRTVAIPLAASFALLLGACAGEKTKEEAQPAQPAAGTAGQQPQAGAVGAGGVAANPLHDPNSILAKRSVYYDFDRSEIKSEFRPMVEAHAGYLRDHAQATVRIEGNCDERGSREYNLALGQRRADGVRKALALLGVADTRIETVSWGEEKPRAQGHDEQAWAQNRRSDIIYTHE